MGEFFGSIFCLFEDFFGIELANYLWGVYSSSQTNSFIGLGLWMTGISLAVALIYYYAIDHPKLNNWWGWSIFLVINAIINFIVGWQIVLRDYYDGMMVKIDPATGNKIPLNISESDILCFGVSDMFLSIAVFIIISFIVKWWSRNCPNTPI